MLESQCLRAQSPMFILTEAKDLCISTLNAQVLRSAQDDNSKQCRNSSEGLTLRRPIQLPINIRIPQYCLHVFASLGEWD